MNRKLRASLFSILAVLSGIAAAYHVAGIFYKVNNSPAWRHSLFILINIICVYGLLQRPRWFTWFFFLLLLQQLYSHGSDIIYNWSHEHRIDWISIAIVVLMPLTFILLVNDRLPARKSSQV